MSPREWLNRARSNLALAWGWKWTKQVCHPHPGSPRASLCQVEREHAPRLDAAVDRLATPFQPVVPVDFTADFAEAIRQVRRYALDVCRAVDGDREFSPGTCVALTLGFRRIWRMRRASGEVPNQNSPR